MDITSIIQHVFKQPSLEGVSLSELERFTSKQPFFAVGQYLLLKKLQDTHDPGFEKQLQKTRLYFENPLWLQQLLLRKNDAFASTAAHHQPVHDVTQNAVDEQALNENKIPEESLPANEPMVHFETDALDTVVNEVFEHSIHEEPMTNNHEVFVEDQTMQEKNEPVFMPVEEAITTAAFFAAETQHIKRVDPAEQDAINAEAESFEENVPLLSDLSENAADIVKTEEMPVIDGMTREEHQDQPVNQEIHTNAEEKQHAVFPEPETAKPAPEKEEELIFQAYHTIDYFASQGIKISHKAHMSDKLGSQLKSFTEWLKTMKRLPPSKLEQQLEEKESEVVLEMAAHSIEQKEVLTETMAEVLLKQGKTESAIEMYNKLNLLNPAKSPYFAAKIEAIKQK